MASKMTGDSVGFLAFLRAARENEAHSLVEFKDFLEFIEKIEEQFTQFRTNRMNGRPLSGMLYINAHASLMGAMRIAFSGQSPPTFMALRGAIESALYALIAGQSTENTDIWLKRASNPRPCRNLYRPRNGLALLKDDPNLLTMMTHAYESTIEFGGHPNLRSVLPHLRFETPTNEGQPVTLTYLHSMDSTEALRSITACVETAISILFMAPHIFPEHPVAATMHSHASGLWSDFQAFIVKQGYVAEPASEDNETKQDPNR